MHLPSLICLNFVTGIRLQKEIQVLASEGSLFKYWVNSVEKCVVEEKIKKQNFTKLSERKQKISVFERLVFITNNRELIAFPVIQSTSAVMKEESKLKTF